MLLQIYIPVSGNALPDRAFYPIGLNGRYLARLQTIVWADQVLGTSNRLIKMRSDCIKTEPGTFPQQIIWVNQSSHTLGNPQGEWKFLLEPQGGLIDIELTSSVAYDGGANNIFQFCILSFDVELL
jgi:hypothetical protein